MAITLHYNQPKSTQRNPISETAAILQAAGNPLGWGVSNCDGIDLIMARSYLRDICDTLHDIMSQYPNASAKELRDDGVFDRFVVMSRRGYWRIQVTVPENYSNVRNNS